VFVAQNVFKVRRGKVVLWGDVRTGSDCIFICSGLPIGFSSLGEPDGRNLSSVRFWAECSPD
jgi:hypothetical protein